MDSLAGRVPVEEAGEKRSSPCPTLSANLVSFDDVRCASWQASGRCRRRNLGRALSLARGTARRARAVAVAIFLRVTYCSATSHILLLYVGECRDVRPWAALPEDPIGVGAHIDRRIGLRLAILGIGACGAQILGSPRYLQKRSSNQGADRLLLPGRRSGGQVCLMVSRFVPR